jgi:hypothetical protein
MEYITREVNNQVEIVMFLVVATEPIGGFRGPFKKTFSPDEALNAAFELENDFGKAANVKIEEAGISKRIWECKFKTPWPLTSSSETIKVNS